MIRPGIGTACALWPLVAAAVLALARAGGGAQEAPARPPLEVSAAREAPDAAAYVGEALALRIVLRNNTPAPLMVPNWDHFAGTVQAGVRITGYPGEHGEAEEAAGPWEGGPFQKSDFRALPPGETVVSRAVTPMLPGKALVTVGVHGPTDEWRSLADGKAYRLENGWTGHIYATLTADVLPTESPATKARCEEVRKRLADPLVPAEQKGRLLAIVGEEKHYFAARFLRETADALPSGPMKDAAIWQLVKLAKVGTAYESFPRLLEWMVQDKTDQDIRVAIMEWAAESLGARGRVRVADQAWYIWPEPLQKQAREDIERLTRDRNPYFAARARETLEHLDSPAPK